MTAVAEAVSRELTQPASARAPSGSDRPAGRLPMR